MITAGWLFAGLLLAASGMLYSHSNPKHKRLAVGLFFLAVLVSGLIGVKSLMGDSSAPAVTGGQINVAGPNNGIISQGNGNTNTLNIGPKDRILSDDQINDLKEAIKPFANDGGFGVMSIMGDSESSALAQQINDAATSCGFKNGLGAELPLGHPLGIEVDVRDANPPPPLAEALIIHLKKYGLLVRPTQNPSWPQSDEDKVVVSVLFNPHPK